PDTLSTVLGESTYGEVFCGEGASSEVDKSSVFRGAHYSDAIPRQTCSNIRIRRMQICTSCTGSQIATPER
ncbi:unnamed protein product, partial [Larinioides sclopetarius]